jgi:hypothetical protein
VFEESVMIPPLSPLSTKVFHVLSLYTAFPWPLMHARCRRHRIDATALSPTTLGFMTHDLALGVARFNGTDAGFAARTALARLMRAATGAPTPRAVPIPVTTARRAG